MILAIVGQKGGVGKTTTALAIGTEWHRRGRSVVLVDADPQGSLRTWGEVAAEESKPAPLVVAMGAGLNQPGQLPALAARYDVAVVDTPPRSDGIMRHALAVADVALLPCGPTPVDAWALATTLSAVEEARIIRPALRAFVLLTRISKRTSLGATAREVLQGSCSLPILRAELGYRTVYAEAPAAGLGVTEYDPTSTAADEVRALVTELEALAGFGRRTDGKATTGRTNTPKRSAR